MQQITTLKQNIMTNSTDITKGSSLKFSRFQYGNLIDSKTVRITNVTAKNVMYIKPNGSSKFQHNVNTIDRQSIKNLLKSLNETPDHSSEDVVWSVELIKK